MSQLQDQHEKAVGDAFFEWLNKERGTKYVFLKRGGEAPDLVYGWNGAELGVEITGAYYDGAHGAFLWKFARGALDAPDSWVGVNPDRSLTEAVVECVRAKSSKQYGSNAMLLVNIPPGTTSFEELARLLSEQDLPSADGFTGVYVCGRFPITTHSAGGYRVIAVKELP